MSERGLQEVSGDLGLPSLSVLRALRKEAEALVKYTQEASWGEAGFRMQCFGFRG